MKQFDLDNLNLAQFDLEQEKSLRQSVKKIKEYINKINCQREAQDDAF